MPLPDFTQPQTGTRPCVVRGRTLYVPKGIRWLNEQWQVTVAWRHTRVTATDPLKGLQDAWLLLQARRQRENPEALVGSRKKIDTGVIGVRVDVHRGRYVVVQVQQNVRNVSRQIDVARIPLMQCSQRWLNRALAEAAAIRRHSERRHAAGGLSAPVTLSDVPAASVAARPVRVVPVAAVWALVEVEAV